MFPQQLKIQESWQQALSLHRDVLAMVTLLGHDPASVEDVRLAKNVPLFPAKRGDRDYLGDSALLGRRNKPSTARDSRHIGLASPNESTLQPFPVRRQAAQPQQVPAAA